MAYYFKDNIFYPINKFLTNTKRYTVLPEQYDILISRYDIYKLSRIVPVSMLASHIQGIPFKFPVTYDNIAFYDVETEKDETFKFGAINGKIYHSASEMVEELFKYGVRVAHNSFRFDIPVLYKATHSNGMGYYELNKFLLYYFKNGIDLDLMFLARLLSFDSLALYGIARELGIPHIQYNGEFTEEKCLQDVEVMHEIYLALDIPEICKVLNVLLSVDLNILQNVYFDRFLRYVLLQAYLNENYLPIEYPEYETRDLTLQDKILKLHKAGEYTDIYYYDTQNAYPITAHKNGLSVYQNENVLPNLEVQLVDLMKLEKPIVRGMLKKIANALIGYMNDKSNYFSNPMIWYETVTQFNKAMTEIIGNIPIVWANTDGFMCDNPNLKIDNLYYTVRLKDHFDYIKIYNPNKYLGVSNLDLLDNKVTLKGFDIPRIDGLRVIQDRLKQLISRYLNIDTAFNYLEYSDILDNDELWKITIRKTSDTCNNMEYLDYWETLEMGFNDLTLTKTDRRKRFNEWRKQF